MDKLYLVGSQQKKYAFLPQETGHVHKKAIILELDTNSGHAEICVEYVTPPEACCDDEPSFTFKAASLQGNRFYVPTQTEILIYDFPSFKQIGYISLPCFNDLHHVLPTSNNNLLVVSTGLDMVVEVNQEGQRVREWNVLGENPWHKFSPEIDYRKIASTKPHASHPNYVFQLGEEIWVTRFEQKDAVCLDNQHKTIDIGIEKAHDGIVYQNNIYFTTVNGYVIVADAETKKIKQKHNLNEITGQDEKISLGWCRSLKIIDQDLVIVGFSRLRPTKFVQNLRWLRYNLGLKNIQEHLPTHIALYDLKNQKIVWEHNLEDKGLNVIFSLH